MVKLELEDGQLEPSTHVGAAGIGERLPGALKPMRYWRGADDILIAGDFWGNPDGQPVLLLHGFGQTRHSWRSCGERLGNAGYYSVAIDLRGHGDSGRGAGAEDYSIDKFIADIAHVLDTFNGRPPVVVGASLGGVGSLLATGEKHITADSLVLVDITPVIEVQGSDDVFAFANSGIDGFETLDAVADAIASYQPHRKRARRLEGLAKNIRLHPDGRYRWHWDPILRDALQNGADETERRRNAAKALDIPLLLVRGMLSNVVSDQGVSDLLALCPDAEVVEIDGVSHMVAGDKNDVFFEAIHDFIAHRIKG